MKAELVALIAKVWNVLLQKQSLDELESVSSFCTSSFKLVAVSQKTTPLGNLVARLLVFFAFLPNAPYVLTDVIHLIEDIREINSVWMITLVVIPVYLLFIVAGFEAYVLSLINLGYYLNQIGKSQWILWAELITHALSAIGIYLGRFKRFNSWDFITQPDALATSVVEDLLGRRPLVITAITFVVVAGLYWIMKRVSLGVFLQRDKVAHQQRVRQTTQALTLNFQG